MKARVIIAQRDEARREVEEQEALRQKASLEAAKNRTTARRGSAWSFATTSATT